MYSTIDRRFWTDQKTSRLKPMEKYVMLYLITSSQLHFCGLGHFSEAVCATQTGIGRRTVHRIMGVLCREKLVKYSFTDRSVWVINKFNYIKSTRRSCSLTREYIESLGQCRFVQDFLGKYNDLLFPIIENSENVNSASGGSISRSKSISINKSKSIKTTSVSPKKNDPLLMLTKRGITESLARDFLALRKEKRAPVTDNAIRRIENETKKAGISLQEAIETCCANGWAGFNAKWVKDRGGGGDRSSKNKAWLDNILKETGQL